MNHYEYAVSKCGNTDECVTVCGTVSECPNCGWSKSMPDKYLVTISTDIPTDSREDCWVCLFRLEVMLSELSTLIPTLSQGLVTRVYPARITITKLGTQEV